jgi:hypothetical protein
VAPARGGRQQRADLVGPHVRRFVQRPVAGVVERDDAGPGHVVHDPGHDVAAGHGIEQPPDERHRHVGGLERSAPAVGVGAAVGDVAQQIVHERHAAAVVHRPIDLVDDRLVERRAVAPGHPQPRRERHLVHRRRHLGPVVGVEQHRLTGRRPVQVGVQAAVHPDRAGDLDGTPQRAVRPAGEQLLADRHAVVVDGEQRLRRPDGRPEVLDGIGGGVDRVGVRVAARLGRGAEARQVEGEQPDLPVEQVGHRRDVERRRREAVTEGDGRCVGPPQVVGRHLQPAALDVLGTRPPPVPRHHGLQRGTRVAATVGRSGQRCRRGSGRRLDERATCRHLGDGLAWRS